MTTRVDLADMTTLWSGKKVPRWNAGKVFRNTEEEEDEFYCIRETKVCPIIVYWEGDFDSSARRTCYRLFSMKDNKEVFAVKTCWDDGEHIDMPDGMWNTSNEQLLKEVFGG